jgi:hypothetical protein
MYPPAPLDGFCSHLQWRRANTTTALAQTLEAQRHTCGSEVVITGFATKAGRSRRFRSNPEPDFSGDFPGDFHPASRETKQERKST